MWFKSLRDLFYFTPQCGVAKMLRNPHSEEIRSAAKDFILI